VALGLVLLTPMLLRSLTRDARFAAGVALRRPFSCLVQVTNRCNMRCSFCDFWPNAAPRRDELTLADYQRVAAEMSALGCFCVSIEGGEPLVRPDIVEIVRTFGRAHVPVLFTNGWYVTPELARALWSAGLAQASVSIDYPDPARHDEKRGVEGTTSRAWRAVEIFRDTAPRGGRQVNVMTVVMEDNHASLAALLAQSRAAGVGHQLTLISVSGYRRGKNVDRLPPPEAAVDLKKLFHAFDHVRFFSSYFDGIGSFLKGGAELPRCGAGIQGFNIDHVGGVAACIERIGESVGNVKDATIAELMRRLALPEVRRAVDGCQDCWTACRGFQQALGGGASTGALRDLATRMRST
jgi:MoaA/NifB/PqqE/SkfB family radical SAM enzyme